MCDCSLPPTPARTCSKVQSYERNELCRGIAVTCIYLRLSPLHIKFDMPGLSFTLLFGDDQDDLMIEPGAGKRDCELTHPHPPTLPRPKLTTHQPPTYPRPRANSVHERMQGS